MCVRVCFLFFTGLFAVENVRQHAKMTENSAASFVSSLGFIGGYESITDVFERQ